MMLLVRSGNSAPHQPAFKPGTQAMMQNGMMGSGMMWGMGLFGLLIAVLLVLGIAALGKYLFRG